MAALDSMWLKEVGGEVQKNPDVQVCRQTGFPHECIGQVYEQLGNEVPEFSETWSGITLGDAVRSRIRTKMRNYKREEEV